MHHKRWREAVEDVVLAIQFLLYTTYVAIRQSDRHAYEFSELLVVSPPPLPLAAYFVYSFCRCFAIVVIWILLVPS